MNEIIIKRAYHHQEQFHQNTDHLRSSRGQAKRCIDRQIKMNEEPNLEMNMLRRGRFSEKKRQPRSNNHSSLSNNNESPRKKSEGMLGDMQMNNINAERKMEEVITSNRHQQIYFKRTYINLKQRRLYFNQKNKIKEANQPLPKTTPLNDLKLKKEDKLPSQDNSHDAKQHCHLSKSLSCKARPTSNLLNPEELFEVYKNNQVNELNKKIVMRMNREREKLLYEQAISHLFELAKRNFFHDKVKSEMPCELDVNKIVIPKRNYREEWTEKVKKYQQNAMKYREECQQRTAGVSTVKKGRDVKVRAKTDCKLREKQGRNQTQLLQRLQWMVLEKPFEPWQYDSISSKFFE